MPALCLVTRRRSAYWALVVAALVSRPASQAGAQEPGQRVRVEADTARRRWITGTVVTSDSAALVLDVPNVSPSLTLQRASLRRVEVSRGVRRSPVRGAVVGALLGSIVGAGIGWHQDSNVPCNSNGFLGSLCGLPGPRADKGFTIGAVGGAVVGAVIGHFARRERWRRVQ